MKKTDAYPCVVRYEDNTYYADFPDFDACFTDADSLGELFVNTKEVLNGVLFTMLDNGLALPKTSDGKSINLKKGEFVLLVEAPIAGIEERLNKKSIKKTLSIPKWLNDLGMKENVNFSKILQEGLKRELNIK